MSASPLQEPPPAPPKPPAGRSSARGTWLPLGGVALVIVVVVGSGFVAGAAVGEAPPPAAIEVAPGLRVHPLPGWEQVQEAPVVLTNGAGQLHVFAATEAVSDPAALLSSFLDQILRRDVPDVAVSDPPEVLTLPPGTAARVTFVGTFPGANTPMEGEVTAVVGAGGTGVVFLGAAAEGLYIQQQPAIREMVDTAEVA